MVKVALYARVSLDEQAEDKRFQDPENQLTPLRELVKAYGYELVGEYIDRASGANPNRPEFRRLMHDALMLRFSGILIWRLDRFSREGTYATLGYLKKLKQRGIFVKSLSESWLDTQDESISNLLLAIFSWVAEEERRKISERTKAGIARRRAIGQWRGGRPKGSKDKKQRSIRA